LQNLQRDSDYRNQFTQLHKAIESSHHSLTEALQTSIFNSRSYLLPIASAVIG
jgi:mannose-binding lectin 1